eukprot:7027978-Pyramimonas_sp.AAC.1
MWPGNGVLGARRTRSGLQLAPGIHNVAWEWRSGSARAQKWRQLYEFDGPLGLGEPNSGDSYRNWTTRSD